MRVLVAGDRGYIGAVLVPFLRGAGHRVDGLGGPQPLVGWDGDAATAEFADATVDHEGLRNLSLIHI